MPDKIEELISCICANDPAKFFALLGSFKKTGDFNMDEILLRSGAILLHNALLFDQPLIAEFLICSYDVNIFFVSDKSLTSLDLAVFNYGQATDNKIKQLHMKIIKQLLQKEARIRDNHEQHNKDIFLLTFKSEKGSMSPLKNIFNSSDKQLLLEFLQDLFSELKESYPNDLMYEKVLHQIKEVIEAMKKEPDATSSSLLYKFKIAGDCFQHNIEQKRRSASAYPQTTNGFVASIFGSVFNFLCLPHETKRFSESSQAGALLHPEFHSNAPAKKGN